MSINFQYKLGDLVYVPKKKKCGVILSWYVDDNDMLMFEVEMGIHICHLAEYEIEHNGCE
jgi:hypothetical protein